MKKMIILWVSNILLVFTSCEPVKIVSVKCNDANVISFPQGEAKIVGYCVDNRRHEMLFLYSFRDTIFFRPDIYTLRYDSVFHRRPFVPDCPYNGKEHIMHGDSLLDVVLFSTCRMCVNKSDTFSVYVNGFFDKNNVPIEIQPITYSIDDEVKYNPFRDGYRAYVSSNKKINADNKKKYLIVTIDGKEYKYNLR